MLLRFLLSFSCVVPLSLALAGCDASSGGAESGGDCKQPSCSQTTRENNSCNDGASIQLGKYRVLNNLWGKNHAGVTGSQCTWSTCSSDSGISWGTEYSWSGGPVGQVTSYSAAILGWHFSTIPADSWFPVLLTDHRPIDCSWSFDVKTTAASTQNVAYDIWLSPEASPTGTTKPTDEVMIWLYRAGPASPIGGNAVDTLSLPSGNFALSEGRNGPSDDTFEAGVNGWNVHSFVRTGNQPCSDLNITDFLDFLIEKHGLTTSVDVNGQALPKSVIGIEAGTEIFSGGGTLTTNHFSCTL